MTTHLTKKDIAKLRETKYITFENREAIKKIVDIKHIIREIKSLKYVNEIEISDNPFGLLISIKETIYAYYPPLLKLSRRSICCCTFERKIELLAQASSGSGFFYQSFNKAVE